MVVSVHFGLLLFDMLWHQAKHVKQNFSLQNKRGRWFFPHSLSFTCLKVVRACVCVCVSASSLDTHFAANLLTSARA